MKVECNRKNRLLNSTLGSKKIEHIL